MADQRLYRWKRHGTHCIGDWVGPRAVLNKSGKTHPTGIRSPDRPARSESLYLLSYPGSQEHICERVFFQTQEKVSGDSRSLQNNVVGRTPYLERFSRFRSAVTSVEGSELTGSLPTRQTIEDAQNH